MWINLCFISVLLLVSKRTPVTLKMSNKSRKMIQYLGCRIQCGFYNLASSRTLLFPGKFSSIMNLLFLSFKLRTFYRGKLTAFTKWANFHAVFFSIKRERGSAGLWRPTHLLDMNYTSRKHMTAAIVTAFKTTF